VVRANQRRPRADSLKALLAAAPLEDVDISRARDHGREPLF